MKQLTAIRPVLYMGRLYSAGEALPAHDGKMVKAWLFAGSAEWRGEATPKAAKSPAAIKKTAKGKASAAPAPESDGGAQ